MRDDYLATMGIQTWKSRRVLPGAKVELNYQLYPLFANEQVWGYLVIEVNSETAAQEEKVNNLLDAMLGAIGLKRGANESNSRQQITEQRVIVMALELNSDFFKAKNAVNCYHPLTLLQQPLLKRQAWSILQSIK